MEKSQDLSRFEVGAEYSVPFGEVVDRRHFGSFAVTMTTRGALFETYTGYHVWTTPFVTGVDGVARAKTLYAWLEALVAVDKRAEEDGGALVEGTGDAVITYKDLRDMLRIVTEANMLHPVSAFHDEMRAQQFAMDYMKWLEEKAKELGDAMAAPLVGDDMADEADLRVSAAQSEVSEILQSIAEEHADDVQ